MKGFNFINATYVQGITDVYLTSLNFMNKFYWMEGQVLIFSP
jgi:hypothetical protein